MKHTAKLAVPFFRPLAGRLEAHVTYWIPVTVNYEQGSQNSPSHTTQAELRDEGYWNRVILLEDSVIIKRYNSDPASIHDVAKMYGNPRHDASIESRIQFLQTTKEFAWVVAKGDLRGNIVRAWRSIDVFNIQVIDDAARAAGGMDLERWSRLLQASKTMARAFYLAGHITKPMLEFHLSKADDKKFLVALAEQANDTVEGVCATLKHLDQRNPKLAKETRKFLRDVLAGKEVALRDSVPVDPDDETVCLLASQANAERLEESVAEFKAGKTKIRGAVKEGTVTMEAPKVVEGGGGSRKALFKGMTVFTVDGRLGEVVDVFLASQQVSVKHDAFTAHRTATKQVVGPAKDWIAFEFETDSVLTEAAQIDSFHKRMHSDAYATWKKTAPRFW